MLDSKPMTISVVLDNWCSEVLHRMMFSLVVMSLVQYMCLITFVISHGVGSASDAVS